MWSVVLGVDRILGLFFGLMHIFLDTCDSVDGLEGSHAAEMLKGKYFVMWIVAFIGRSHGGISIRGKASWLPR